MSFVLAEDLAPEEFEIGLPSAPNLVITFCN